MTIYAMKWYQGKKGKWKRKGISKRNRGNCKMTLKSGRISSDFELFNEILEDVESNKKEDDEFFTRSNVSEEKECVNPERIIKNKRYEGNKLLEDDNMSSYQNFETVVDSFDEPDRNNSKSTQDKRKNSDNSNNTPRAGNDATDDNDDDAYYDDSDFESISSNNGTETDDSDYESSKRSSRTDKSSGRRSYKTGESSKNSSKSSTKGFSSNDRQKDIRRNDVKERPSEMTVSEKPDQVNDDEEAYQPTKRSCLKSGKSNNNCYTNSPDNCQTTHAHEDKEMKERENACTTPKRSRKFKNKLKRDEEYFKLRRNEDIYKMYRETNFRIMENLWQGFDPGKNKRARSKSAAPAQLKSRKQLHERSRNLARRPQSVGGKKSKKINLAFSNEDICRKVDDRVEDSGNPVLLSWLDSKKKIASQQNKIQKEEKKVRQFQDRQEHIKAYQRTMDSSEKVKQWMDGKKQLDKQKRLQRNDLLEKLKFDTINHQRRLVSPMFVRNHFCEMNPAVINQLKQKTDRRIAAPLKDSTNKITSPPDNKITRETFFKYYLNDPVCPKGYATIRSFTDSVLHDAAKEIARDMAVKVRRLGRGKTSLPLSELNQSKEYSYENSKAKHFLTCKPPLPPKTVKTSTNTNSFKSSPHPSDMEAIKSDHPQTPENIRKCMQENKRLREEKEKNEKNVNSGDYTTRQEIESKLKANR